MDRYQKTVLNELLNKYERSRSYLGENRVSQNFAVIVAKKFPQYADDSEYDLFREINDSLLEIEEVGIIRLEYEKNGIIKKAVLANEKISECYSMLGRVPRRQKQESLLSVIDRILSDRTDSRYQSLTLYLKEQQKRIARNRNVEFYDGDIEKYRQFLEMAAAVLENEEETYIRDFSIKLFHDSKTAEELRSKVQSMLYQYGESEEKEHILEENGIVNTPTYVYIKGCAEIVLGGQHIDLKNIRGDLALSSETLKDLSSVAVTGRKVITVENLTSFHDFNNSEYFVIYLGGFHNRTRRNFLKKVYDDNPGCSYFHFGDIDAGGFYIVNHLREKTGIGFKPVYMGKDTLEKFREFAKPLTQSDRKRLENLLEKYKDEDDREYAKICSEAVEYMLINNCKLEQEAVMLQKPPASEVNV